MVALGLQLLVLPERVGSLHRREHRPVQVQDVRFCVQEGLDGSGIRTLHVKLSLRRLVQAQDVRFRLQEGLNGRGIHAFHVKLSRRRLVHIHDIRFRLREGLDGSGIRVLCLELSLLLPVLLWDRRVEPLVRLHHGGPGC